MSNMSINGTIKERASGILLTALGVSLMIATNVFSSARHVSGCTSEVDLWYSVPPILAIICFIIGVVMLISKDGF